MSTSNFPRHKKSAFPIKLLKQYITLKYTITLFLLIISFSSIAQSNLLKLSNNQRYIENGDHTPFIWIGDTAWELFHKLDRRDAKRYLKTRAKQGFTIIQAVILAEDDGLRKPNIYGEVPFIGLDPKKTNEKYFEHVDFIINEAEKLGLQIALLPTWGDKVFSDREGNGPVVFNKENAFVYGEFLGKRYRDKPVVWVLGGDRNIANNKAMVIWRAMANGIKKGDDARHLMTYHPAGEQSSSQYKEDWIDFNMYQTGHAHKYMPVYRFAEVDYNSIPVKPFIDAEPAYEDIPVKFWEYIKWNEVKKVPDSILNRDRTIKKRNYFEKGFFTDYDVRVHAYWNFLSGACGYTYGNNAVWQMFKKNGDFTIPCLTDWKDALERPGANDMKHVRRFFETIPFSTLVPNQSIILNTFANDSTYISAATTKDNSTAVVYLAHGQNIKLSLHQFKSDLISACWYNPRNGKFTKPTLIEKKPSSEFIPPTNKTADDWMLVLKSH